MATKKPKPTAKATAHIRDVELGKHNSKTSMEIKVENLGIFYIAQIGIEFLPADGNDRRKGYQWGSLADTIRTTGYKAGKSN